MKKLKLFLEFVTGNKKSLFIPLTYDEISKKLNCSIDEVEEFENYLDENIKPGEVFHGSFDSTTHDDEDKPVAMFDEIESEEQYLEVYRQYKHGESSSSSMSHSEDGL